MAEHTKVPVVIRDNYVMYLEFYENLIWFHTDVKKWNSKVKKQFLEDLNLLQYLVNVPLMAYVEDSNTKLAKFAQLINFEKDTNIMLENGEKATIFIRSK
jgi:hypothetical protein